MSEVGKHPFERELSDGLMFERRLFRGLFAAADQKKGMDVFVNNRAGVPQRLRRVVQPVTRPSACATRMAAQASLAA